jgi:hypothetical protein
MNGRVNCVFNRLGRMIVLGGHSQIADHRGISPGDYPPDAKRSTMSWLPPVGD